MKRSASAVWKGGLKDGRGTISSASGVLADTQYSFSTRFEEGKGTNPEELIAAAQAACYSMQLAAMLAEGGTKADSVNTEAKVQILKQGDGFAITRIELVTVARVPGIDENAFQETAKAAKEACLISQALGAVPQHNLDARLES
jgi:osmotically inducible protein OsmC